MPAATTGAAGRSRSASAIGASPATEQQLSQDGSEASSRQTAGVICPPPVSD